jgi:hypothetical protein
VEVEDTVQIEEAVRSTVCPFEDPWAIKFWLVPTAAFQVSGVLPLEQVVVAPKVPSQIWKLVTLVRSTFACVVPVMAPEAAVMVAVPWPAPVADPLVVMVTTVASEVDQQTVLPLQLVPPVRVDVLPSWKVPVAVICWVAPWLIVGVGGSIVMVLRVGF